MKLNEASIRWAIEHLKMESDTDLFPKPFEISIINDLKEKTVQYLINVDLVLAITHGMQVGDS